MQQNAQINGVPRLHNHFLSEPYGCRRYIKIIQEKKRMILELTAKTSVEDVTIEFIQVTTKQGESISLNWETSYLMVFQITFLYLADKFQYRIKL